MLSFFSVSAPPAKETDLERTQRQLDDCTAQLNTLREQHMGVKQSLRKCLAVSRSWQDTAETAQRRIEEVEGELREAKEAVLACARAVGAVKEEEEEEDEEEEEEKKTSAKRQREDEQEESAGEPVVEVKEEPAVQPDIPCKYGAKCYNKSPAHLAKYGHPDKATDGPSPAKVHKKE